MCDGEGGDGVGVDHERERIENAREVMIEIRRRRVAEVGVEEENKYDGGRFACMISETTHPHIST